jgi:hypothetical protein
VSLGTVTAHERTFTPVNATQDWASWSAVGAEKPVLGVMLMDVLLQFYFCPSGQLAARRRSVLGESMTVVPPTAGLRRRSQGSTICATTREGSVDRVGLNVVPCLGEERIGCGDTQRQQQSWWSPRLRAGAAILGHQGEDEPIAQQVCGTLREKYRCLVIGGQFDCLRGQLPADGCQTLEGHSGTIEAVRGPHEGAGG